MNGLCVEIVSRDVNSTIFPIEFSKRISLVIYE
jgi:hypothetical protein